jgi:putative hydrolase of the HAD superfamily
MGRPEAILFDLWGTLVPGIPGSVRDAVSHEMAGDLGVGPEEFAAAYRDSYRERFTGATGTLEETIVALTRRCGGAPPPAAVARAAQRRLDLLLRLLRSDDVTLAVLDELVTRGFPLALVSDSSAETPTLWPRSPLSTRIHVTAFSCALGVRKPDPAIYLHAVDRLGASPGACLYVGDGGGGELTGAAALGMTVVRVRPPGDSPIDRYDDDAAFDGDEIAALGELLVRPEVSRAR